MITKKFVVTSTTYYGNGSNLKTPIEDNWTCMIAGLPTTQHVAHNTLIPCPQHVAHNTLPTTSYPQHVTHNMLPTTCYPQYIHTLSTTRCPQHIDTLPTTRYPQRIVMYRLQARNAGFPKKEYSWDPIQTVTCRQLQGLSHTFPFGAMMPTHTHTHTHTQGLDQRDPGRDAR